MTSKISQDARAVLLPAFDGLVLSIAVQRFLGEGGVSILIGESREEYVARRMCDRRQAVETPEALRKTTDDARSRSGALLAAVDQELAGICRLEGLVPAFPKRDELAKSDVAELEKLCSRIAQGAVGMGINVFLAPILDVLENDNPWLNGRTWSQRPEDVARVSAAFIRGVQKGGVASTAKHFPGFRSVTADPAVEAAALCLTSEASIAEGLLPFRAAVAAGVEMMMVGPAPVVAWDPMKTAFRSSTVVGKLTGDLKYRGVVMADDLDAQAAMRGDSIPEVALDALNAGCDFLLLADIGDQLDIVVDAIVKAATSGRINPDKLATSAEKVRSLARRYSASAV